MQKLRTNKNYQKYFLNRGWFRLASNTFKWYTMEYLTSHLYFLCLNTPLWVYVYTKKVDMTSKIFHDVLQESFCTKLSSKEKNEKNK